MKVNDIDSEGQFIVLTLGPILIYQSFFESKIGMNLMYNDKQNTFQHWLLIANLIVTRFGESQG